MHWPERRARLGEPQVCVCVRVLLPPLLCWLHIAVHLCWKSISHPIFIDCMGKKTCIRARAALIICAGSVELKALLMNVKHLK